MASMLTFAPAARNADWLMAARLVQGVAVGLASTAASAALLELQPTPGVGALTGATAPSFGLAFGSLITGFWVDFGPSPTVAVFLTLAVVCALGLVTVSVHAGDGRTKRPALELVAAASNFRAARAAQPVRAPGDRDRRHLGHRWILFVARPVARRRAAT